MTYSAWARCCSEDSWSRLGMGVMPLIVPEQTFIGDLEIG